MARFERSALVGAALLGLANCGPANTHPPAEHMSDQEIKRFCSSEFIFGTSMKNMPSGIAQQEQCEKNLKLERALVQDQKN